MKLKKLLNNGIIKKLNVLHVDVLLTTIFQFATIFFSLILLPKSLDLVKTEEYGLWLAIGSIFVWISYFDFGLSAGLKNKLIISLSKEDFNLCREYISTAYFLNTLVSLILGLVFYILNKNDILLHSILNVTKYNAIELTSIKNTINIVFLVFLIRFVLQTINPIFEAKQKLFLVKLVLFISQFSIYILLILLSNRISFNLFRLSLVFSIVPVLVILFTSIYFFGTNTKLIPSLKYININLLPELYSLSIKFFLVQLNMLVLFQSTNFLILKYLGSGEVVKYSIAFNLFSMMNIVFSSIAAPYWTAYAKAWTRKDNQWIIEAQKKLLKIWFTIVIISFVVLIFSQKIYLIWVGGKVLIPFDLSVAVYIYMVFFTFGLVYNIFINSTGKIYLQTLSLTILTLLYIPLVITFIRVFNLGLISIPISLCIVSLYTILIAPIQSKRLLNGSASGILIK